MTDHGVTGKAWNEEPTHLPLYFYQYPAGRKTTRLTDEEYEGVTTGAYPVDGQPRGRKMTCVIGGNEFNPIFGNAETGTLFDVYLTALTENRFRMDLSTRKNHSVSVSFSDDGIHWTDPVVTLGPNPASGWEDMVNRNCVLKIGDTYKM